MINIVTYLLQPKYKITIWMQPYGHLLSWFAL